MKPETKVVTLKARSQRAELARINRLTGLEFSEVPVSLVNDIHESNEQETGECLMDSALAIWRQ